MSTKVQFIKKVHNKIQIDQIFYKKTLKRSKKTNKIRIDKNIERVQDKQPKKKTQKDYKMKFNLSRIIIQNDFEIVQGVTITKNTHST
jgi:hypothetical protein